MIPGPNYVYKCPNCNTFFKRGSLTSGNTFETKIYSDGKRESPMLPEFPQIIKCKKCNFIFWIHKLTEIGSYNSHEEPVPEWRNAFKAEFLTIDEYFESLDLNVAEI